MGNRASFSRGTIIGKRVRSDGKYVPNSLSLVPNQFCLDPINIQSGTLTGILSGSGVSTGNREYFGWNEGQGSDLGKAMVVYHVPKNIPPGAKTDITLYWTSSGAATGNTIFDVDYKVTSFWISGQTAGPAGYTYVVSGAYSNATTTYSALSGVFNSSGTTGTLQKSTITIPATDTKPESIVEARLYRDADEAGDTYNTSADVILVKIAFVE